MKLLALSLLIAPIAFADVVTSVTVLSTATPMPATISNTRRSLLVENKDAASIYCSPSSSVTVSTGFEIGAASWRSFPSTVVWCIASVSQTGSGSSRTMVWESDS